MLYYICKKYLGTRRTQEMTKQFERFNNDDLLDEYFHFRILHDELDRTSHSDYYVNYVEKQLNDVKEECLKRMK